VERREAEVCIVGAGPAGLVVAHRLQQARVPFIVVEQLSSGTLSARAKAGMIEQRTVRALTAHGLAAPILEQGTTNGVTEICLDGQRRAFDYAALTGGCGHHVYPQHRLVQAWADSLIERGGALLFATRVTAIDTAAERPVPSPQPAGALVRACGAGGAPIEIACNAVVLAAGAGAGFMPSGLIPASIASHEHTHPFRWLTAMVEMPPLGERTIYAAHRNGFAAHLRRSPALTRYYLQIDARDGLGDWPDERLRTELELRLGVGQGVIAGPILERDVLDLRVRVCEPLQSGCVYLAGDAAHLITPAGGKGMNLAIMDGLELAQGLIERCQGSPARLERYSQARLPSIWRAQEFSNWMLTLFCGGVLGFHRAMPNPAAGFARGLHRAQVERLFSDPAFARWFAHAYAGVDEVA
jgi:p-hydroxybenzoate 3-monooxygenase